MAPCACGYYGDERALISRMLKLARTIADLAGEALQYRPRRAV